MRFFLTLIFIFMLGFTAAILLFRPDSPFALPLQGVEIVLFIILVLDRIFGWFKPKRTSTLPSSLMSEIEQLYFRSVRAMLEDEPNLQQVITDFNRVVAIDPHYQNAQHYLNRAVMLQAQSGGNSRQRLHDSEDFQSLQERLVDPDAAVRKAVIMDLIRFNEDAIDPLIALLMDEDGDVRVHAATALGMVGGKEAVRPLLVALQDDNPFVRRYAARALCWVVDASALDGLIYALDDNDNYVRQYAARALGWSGDKRALQPIIELLMGEQNQDVREYALTALSDLGEAVRLDRAKTA